MAMQEIMSAVFLLAVLFLVLPSFLNTNTKFKQLIQNISIWAIIVLIIVVIIKSYLVMKKINLTITGCLGRMGQQLIKSSKKNKILKLFHLLKTKIFLKKFYGIKPELNTLMHLKKLM